MNQFNQFCDLKLDTESAIYGRKLRTASQHSLASLIWISGQNQQLVSIAKQSDLRTMYSQIRTANIFTAMISREFPRREINFLLDGEKPANMIFSALTFHDKHTHEPTKTSARAESIW